MSISPIVGQMETIGDMDGQIDEHFYLSADEQIHVEGVSYFYF